jgi:hypothetical protein
VVLVGVIGLQMVDLDASAQPRAKEETTQDTTTLDDSPETSQAEITMLEAPQREFRDWEAIALDEVLLHDPFMLPEALQAAIVKSTPELTRDDIAGDSEISLRRQETLALLREKGVGMIWSTPQGYVATIGQRELRVGDEFDGLRVLEIGPRGVVLVEHETPSTDGL